MTTEERASKLLKDVLEAYYSREAWDKRPLKQMIDEKLAAYNEDMVEAIDNAINVMLTGVITKSTATIIPDAVKLSQKLYKNSKKIAREVYEVLKDAQGMKKTATTLARTLYDGYNFKDERVIDVMEDLPKYIQDYINNPKSQADILKQVDKLQTKPLKTAVAGIVKSIDNVDSKAFKNAMRQTLEEKSRFYADRIAKTETQRAKSLGDAYDMMYDDDIELVRFEMSSLHKIFDICDGYANLDVGYGRGIVKKRDMVALPLHPFCMCKYVPVYRTIKKEKISNPIDKMMDSLSDEEKRDILGSYERVDEYKAGKPFEEILNSNRPKYPITKVKKFI